jgi:hypothetical protein
MSKRCELQKQYYQQYGNYKGDGKYCDKYVSWLEEQILALRIHSVIGSVCGRVGKRGISVLAPKFIRKQTDR